MAAAYDAGRATPLQWMESWRRAVAPFVPAPGVVLDLGAGTGIWAEALARWFGPVLVRNAFSGRTGGVPWLKYWPHARAAAESHWPTLEAVELAFGAAGFRRERLEPVTQVVDPSLAAYARRARFRADSTLAALNVEDFATGMRALAAAAAEEREPRPVEATIDLLVMR